MLMSEGPEQAIQAVYSLTKVLSLQGSGPRLLVIALPVSISTVHTSKLEDSWDTYRKKNGMHKQVFLALVS